MVHNPQVYPGITAYSHNQSRMLVYRNHHAWSDMSPTTRKREKRKQGLHQYRRETIPLNIILPTYSPADRQIPAKGNSKYQPQNR